MQKATYTRGQISAKTGCKLETVRYYEKVGLLLPTARSRSGYRLYAEEDAKRLRFIRRCRELGFSISDIRDFLGIVEKRAYTCADICAVTQVRIADVKDKISDLKKILKALENMSAKCPSGTGKDCPILEALEK